MSDLDPKDPYNVNPKDALAANKWPLHVVLDSLAIIAAMAFTEGALKYGQYSWRSKPVHMSVYITALLRHTKALNSGQWADPKTRVPHVSSILACAGIIGDADICGTLIHDRPPLNSDVVKFMDSNMDIIKHLNELFKGHNPHQYTEQDNLEHDGTK